MLTLILSTLGPLLSIVLQSTGVLGPNGTQLVSSLTGLGVDLYTKIKSGTTASGDIMAGLVTLKGVIEVLKSTTGLSPEVLTQLGDIDGDITAAMVAYAKAGLGFDVTAYAPLPQLPPA